MLPTINCSLQLAPDGRIPPKRLSQPPSYHQAVRRSYDQNQQNYTNPDNSKLKDKPQLRVEPLPKSHRNTEYDNQYDRGVPHHQSRRTQQPSRTELPKQLGTDGHPMSRPVPANSRASSNSDYQKQPSYRYNPATQNSTEVQSHTEATRALANYQSQPSHRYDQPIERTHPKQSTHTQNLQQSDQNYNGRPDGDRGDPQLEISDEYLQYQRAEIPGQRGQTAMVLAHIEPSVSLSLQMYQCSILRCSTVT